MMYKVILEAKVSKYLTKIVLWAIVISVIVSVVYPAVHMF